jgi:hypothetical protein
MRKLVYSISVLCASTSLFAQDFTYLYEPPVAGDYIVLRDLIETNDGNILAGYDLMPAGGAMPVAGLMKTNEDGAVLWSKTFTIPESVAGCTFEVAENAAGNFYLWGLSKESGTDNMRAILSEITQDGEMLWSKEYDFGYNATPSYTINKLHILPSGDLQMMIAVYGQVIILKTDAAGELIWGKTSAMGPPDEGGKNPGFEWLVIPDDGGLCVSKAENDFSLLRYNEDGEMMWNKAYKLGTYSHAKTVASAPNGNVLVAGFVLGVDGFYAPYIMELSDEDGSIVWIKNTHDETLPFMGKAHLNVVGDEITLDFTNGTNHEIFLSLSAEGEVLKTMKSEYPTFDYNKLEVVEDATYFYGSAQVTGEHKGMMHRTADIFEESCMIKENTPLAFTDFTEYSEIVFEPFNGEFTNQVDIAITLADLGLKVKLGCEIYLGDDSEELTTLTVYPNPAANELSISISEEMVNAVYTITDLAGKTVLTDNFTTTFMNVDLSTLVVGQYILTVSSENEVMTEKITVVR